jgi:hypothetical protein
MTEAPEKMWVFPKANWFIAGASTDRICTGGRLDVAYTRTDIADARTAELERAEKAVIDLIEQNAELIKQNETLRTLLDNGYHYMAIAAWSASDSEADQ